MKNIIASMALFVFLTFAFSDKVAAILPPLDDIRDNVQIKLPTATPTPLILKKIDPNINLQLITTIVPAKATVTPEPTLSTKLTVTPEPTLSTKLTATPTQEVTGEETDNISPSITATGTEEETGNKTDLKSWFMIITIGLLLLIIVVQLWPKKKVDL